MKYNSLVLSEEKDQPEKDSAKQRQVFEEDSSLKPPNSVKFSSDNQLVRGSIAQTKEEKEDRRQRLDLIKKAEINEVESELSEIED